MNSPFDKAYFTVMAMVLICQPTDLTEQVSINYNNAGPSPVIFRKLTQNLDNK